MYILLGVLGMFQLELCQFYSDFKIKSSENSCKNYIFAILFKIYKYIKKIHQKTKNFNANLMQVIRNCNFSVQNGQRYLQ